MGLQTNQITAITVGKSKQYGMVLWDEAFERVAANYPDVATESVVVDAMSAKFILHPEELSVVVASNLNADNLSDLGSAQHREHHDQHNRYVEVLRHKHDECAQQADHGSDDSDMPEFREHRDSPESSRRQYLAPVSTAADDRRPDTRYSAVQ